jgi:phosphoinositide-3-kinase regulatory subunit 4
VHTTLKERLASTVVMSPCEKLFVAYQARPPHAPNSTPRPSATLLTALTLRVCPLHACALQLLHALAQCHSRGVIHGDITPSNVALTSFGWLLLTDFASAYKPALLPADNPALFTFYYDTDGSRACTVAPERFVDGPGAMETGSGGGGGDASSAQWANCSPASDMFSAGAVLGAVFSGDGAPLCDLAALMTWRSGGADPRTATLAHIAADPGLGPPVAALVERLTHKAPGQRMTASEALSTFEGVLWKPYYPLARSAAAAALSAVDGDPRAGALTAALPDLCAAIISCEAPEALRSVTAASDGRQHAASVADAAAAVHHAGTPLPGATLLGTLTCSALACATRRSTKAAALRWLLTLAAPLCDAPHRATRLLPYALALVNDRAPPLRAAAVAATVELLAPNAGAGGPDPVWTTGAAALSTLRDVLHYVAPAVSRSPNDPEECVRTAAARAMPHLIALVAQALDRAAMGDEGPLAGAPGASSPVLTPASAAPYRASLAAFLRDTLAPDVLVGAHSSGTSSGGGASAAAAVAALEAAVSAGDAFLVRAGGAEALLPAALACLNERLWRARRAAYAAAPALASALGPAAAHALASAAENGLHDAHPAVACAAARSLAAILRGCARRPGEGQLHAGVGSPLPPALRRSALSAAVTAAPLRCHPSCHMRSAAADVMAAAVDALGSVDAAALLAPLLAPFCGGTPAAARALLAYDMACSGVTLLAAAPPPVSWRDWQGLGTAARAAAIADTGADAWPQGAATIRALSAAAAASARRGAALQADGGPPGSSTSSQAATLPLYTSTPHGGSQPQLVTTHATSPHGQRGVAAAVMVAASQPLGAAAFHRAGGGVGLPDPGAGVYGEGGMTSWRPCGVLAAHYTEHRGCVNALAVCPPSSDGVSPPAVLWVASASDDGSAKVWDAAPSGAGSGSSSGGCAPTCCLRSCVTYSSQGGRLTAVVAMGTDTVATGSDTGSVHLWRLERPGTSAQSRSTAAAGSRPATSSGTVAAAAAAATTTTYTGASDVRRGASLWDSPSGGGGCTALASSPRACPHLLLMASVTGGVAAWDTRAAGCAWRLPLRSAAAAPDGPAMPRGAPTALVMDPGAGAWVVVGTSTGVVCLWDCRFHVPVASWCHPSTQPVTSLALSQPHAPGGRPHVAVACGATGEVAALDLLHGSVTSIMRLRRPHDGDEPAAMAGEGSPAIRPPPVGEEVGGDPDDPLTSPEARLSAALTIRAVLPAGGGSFITAGDDASLRQWEPYGVGAYRTSSGGAPQGVTGVSPACRLIAAPSHAPCLDGTPVVAAWRGVQVLQQRLRPSTAAGGPAAHSAAQRRQDVEAHSDAITAIAALPLTGWERLLFSASRDGMVKAWR